MGTGGGLLWRSRGWLWGGGALVGGVELMVGVCGKEFCWGMQLFRDGLVSRIERKLAGWKGKYLSKGGKLTLIRSTLSSIPTYFMSLHIMPISVAKQIEKLQRDFLWGSDGGVKRYSLVGWDSICQAKSSGGLGVRSLATFNRALLGK